MLGINIEGGKTLGSGNSIQCFTKHTTKTVFSKYFLGCALYSSNATSIKGSFFQGSSDIHPSMCQSWSIGTGSTPRVRYAGLFAKRRGRCEPSEAKSKICCKVSHWPLSPSLRRGTAGATPSTWPDNPMHDIHEPSGFFRPVDAYFAVINRYHNLYRLKKTHTVFNHPSTGDLPELRIEHLW